MLRIHQSFEFVNIVELLLLVGRVRRWRAGPSHARSFSFGSSLSGELLLCLAAELSLCGEASAMPGFLI